MTKRQNGPGNPARIAGFRRMVNSILRAGCNDPLRQSVEGWGKPIVNAARLGFSKATRGIPYIFANTLLQGKTVTYG